MLQYNKSRSTSTLSATNVRRRTFLAARPRLKLKDLLHKNRIVTYYRRLPVAASDIHEAISYEKRILKDEMYIMHNKNSRAP